MQNLEDVAEINEDDVVNTLNEDASQEEGKCILEQEQTHTEVLKKEGKAQCLIN